MSYRIIVADKDSESRAEVTRFLAQEENEFVAVSSADELKRAIKSHRPDLIILNAVLPDAPGWKVAQKIKDSKDYSDVPVLLMTGDPGGPTLTEVKKSGADRYLTKPIDGTALTSAVRSLLGISIPTANDKDEEIIIDFAEEDSEELTDDLLTISSEALEGEEPATDVGDTVEIDAGSLAAEIDAGGELEELEELGDTVKLNLEDLELEDHDEDAPSLEPTIELVSEPLSEVEELASEGPLEAAADAKASAEAAVEGLPDFSSITVDAAPGEQADKDSITVDLDVEDLSLELDSEEVEVESAPEGALQIDPDDTEIEKLLDLQEPSKILTSKDLMLEDDSLMRDSLSESGMEGGDIIDLEEDREIADIEVEQLEGIDITTVQEGTPDRDATTVPVGGTEMEQIAKEHLRDTELSESIDEPAERGQIEQYEEVEPDAELSLEEAGEEQISTEEFFGEELPTEEFPTERFPGEETVELTLEEEISLDETDLTQEITLDEEFPAGEPAGVEIEPAAASAEEILSDYAGEEEPWLEVTEDISLEEISLEEKLVAPRQKEAVGPAPERPAVEIPVPTPEPSKYPKEFVAAFPAAAQTPSALKEALLSQEQLLSTVGAVVSEKVREAMSARAGVTELAQPDTRSYVPDRQHFTEVLSNAVEAVLPTKREMLEAVSRAIRECMPEQETVLSRIDEVANSHLPSQEALMKSIEETIRALLPTRKDITAWLDRSLENMPSADSVLGKIEEHLAAVIPTRDQIYSTFTTAIEKRFDTLLAATDFKDAIPGMLPKTEDILRTLREALPEKERLQETVAQGLAHAIGNSLPERVWLESVSRGLFDERTKGLLPERHEIVAMLREEIQSTLLDSVEKIVKDQIEKITADLQG